MAGGVSQVGFIEMEKPTLKVGGTIPWAGVL